MKKKEKKTQTIFHSEIVQYIFIEYSYNELVTIHVFPHFNINYISMFSRTLSIPS